jgi:lipoprotein-anchoring transpeptidase ErfK/SrfK
LHGTDTPASLFQAASHGCVRFTNWDVEELAHLVKPGTAVDFLA